GQPVRIGPSVRVDVRDDLPGGGPQPLVAGGAHAAVGRGNRAARIPPDDIRGPVRGPVVDDDDLVVRIIELHQGPKAIVQGAGRVVRGYDDRDPGKPSLGRGWH